MTREETVRGLTQLTDICENAYPSDSKTVYRWAAEYLQIDLDKDAEKVYTEA